MQDQVVRDGAALNSALDLGVLATTATHYRLKRNEISAAFAGHRAWPEELNAENVAAWIMANVSYPFAGDAHEILKGYLFEGQQPLIEALRKARTALQMAEPITKQGQQILIDAMTAVETELQKMGGR